MIEVKIPAEIKDYKSKLIFGLTTRQVIAIIGSLAVGVPLGVFGTKYIPMDILMWLVILSVTPIIGWGFATYKGMRFEEFIKVMFRYYWYPQKRYYEDVDMNYLSFVNKILVDRGIIHQRIHSGEIDEDDIDIESEESNYEYE